MNEIALFFEKVFAYIQGKGYGAETVEREVVLALKLLETPPKLVLDVGANKGNWTNFLLKRYPFTSVHAFEPQPWCIKFLEERFSSIKGVSIHRNAVSDVEATLKLFFDFEGSGLASLSNRKLGHFGIDFSKSVEVKTVVLDVFLAHRELGQIDIIKIDVEGHELAVFKGMEKILAGRTPPKVIQFEFGGCNIDTRTYFRDFFLMFNNKYEIHRQTPFGLTAIEQYRETDECFRTTNFFLKLRNFPKQVISVAN